MEDFEYNEQKAEEMWIHQEEYLGAPLVRERFRDFAHVDYAVELARIFNRIVYRSR